MAKKATPIRTQAKNNSDQKRVVSDEMKAYAANFNKAHYRTIGVKFNINKEKEILAWLDYQPTLKPYIKRLIVEDMSKAENKEELNKAIEYYNNYL